MAHVMEDVRTHYEISYVPVSTDYDGRFRQVRVSLRDPKLMVQSREGYFALPDLNGIPLRPYEMEGLKVLQAQARKDFDFQVAALRFRPWRNGFHYEMAFDLDTANLTTQVDDATHQARIHGTFLALLKNSSGQIVSKVSQEIDREVPAEKLEAFRKGKIVFTSEFEAAPGRYTVEAAVNDPQGNRASTKRVALFVPQATGLELSSLTVVRDIEALHGPVNAGNPLEFTGGRVTPALSQTAPKGADALLYFVVYTQTAEEKPRVTVEFVKDGTEVSRVQPELGNRDELGAIPVLTAAKLPPGQYLARVTVEQAGKKTSESLAVTIEPVQVAP